MLFRGRCRHNFGFYTKFRNYTSKDDQTKMGDKEIKYSDNRKKLPEPPTTCCMTGCPNCVWLDYAEALTEYFKDGGKNAVAEIEKHVTDPNVKAYLMHELKMRNKK